MNASPTTAARKPTTEGNFSKTPLVNVLLYARDKKLTGTLTVRIEPEDEALRAVLDVAGESHLVFEEGSIVAVRLPRVVDNLAWVLREMELVTDEVFAKAQEAIDGGADEIATVLRLRAVDPLKLDAALKEQARRKVLALFGFPDGYYAYFAGVDLLEGEHRLRGPEDVLPIVWRAFRDHPPDEAAVRAVFEKVGARYIRLREGHEFDRFGFGEELGTAATQLRVAPSSIEQLVGLGREPGLVRAMVYLLALTRQVEAVNPAASSPMASLAPRPMSSIVPPRDSTPSIAPAAPALGTVVGRAPTGSDAGEEDARATQKIRVVPEAASEGPAPEASPAVVSEPAPEPVPEPVKEVAREDQLANDPRVKEAKTHLGRMEHWTYYEMFDLKPTASVEEVRAAYTRVAAQWHPDRAPAPEMRSLYTEVFAHYNAAFGELNDPKKREQYDESLAGGGGTPAAQKQVAAVLGTVQDTQRAELLVRRRDWVEAERVLRGVLKVNADDISANLLLAQTLLELGPQQYFKDIVVMLRKVIDNTENNDRAHFLMGAALKANNDRRASVLFKTALEMNPNNVDALREVRLMEMRHAKRVEEANSTKTQISNFFNKFLKK